MHIKHFLEAEANDDKGAAGGGAGGQAGAGGAGAAADGAAGAGAGAGGAAASGAGAGGASGAAAEAGSQGDKGAAAQAPAFPETWRQTLAAGDEKELKQLERYASPADVWKKTRELEKKLSSGELKSHTPFPAKGTPEDQAAWRKEQGIPEKPDGYDINLQNGVVIGEQDKPMVDAFLAFAHQNNQPPDAVKRTLEWVFGEYREQMEEQSAAAKEVARKAAEDALRADWGADYRANLNVIENLLDANLSAANDADKSLRERIMNSVALEPAFAKLWAKIGRDINPVTTLVGGNAATQMQNVEQRIAELEGLMRTNRPEYNRREGEYRQLVDARDKMKRRAA